MHRSCLKNSTRCNEECKWSWCSCSLLKGCSAQVFGSVACFSSPVKLLRKSDAAGAVHAWRAAAPTRNQTTQIKQKMLFGLFKEPRGAVHVRKPDPVWKVGDVRPHSFSKHQRLCTKALMWRHQRASLAASAAVQMGSRMQLTWFE